MSSEARVTITLSAWRAGIAAGTITPQNAALYKIVADPGEDPDIDISVVERLTTMELFDITSRQINATNGNAGIKLESVFDNPDSEIKIIGSGDISVTSNANGDIVVSGSAAASAHTSDPSRLTTAQPSGFYKVATTNEGHVAGVETITPTGGITLDNSNNLKHTNSVTAGTASGTATSTLENGDSIDIPTITYDAQGHITGKGTTTVTLPAFAAGSGLNFGEDGVTINHSNSIPAGTASGSATSTLDNGGSITIPSVTYDAQGHITDKGSSTVTLPTFAAGDGIKIDVDGLTFKHTNTITAGTASGSATKTLTNGGNFDIPTVTYDAQGHITGKGTTTITLPEFTGSDGVNINGSSITNSGVRSITTGSANGTISVNTNGTNENVSVAGLGNAAYKNTTSTYSATGTDPTTGAAVAEAIASVTNLMGSNNGIATLDSTGKIPSSQMPGSYDDVLNYASISNFPATGEDNTIYVAKDTNIQYRWGGESYIPIGSHLALGETSSTAYRGDRGATAYTHATDTSRLTTAKSEALYTVGTTAHGHVASATAVTVTGGLTFDTSNNLKHSNSIPAGTASGSATETLSNGGSFNIPTITYDAQGHVTGKGTTTITIPTLEAGTGLSLSGTTVSAKLKVTTALTTDSSAASETSGRIYSVVPDKSGNLAVVVPWTDHTYTIPTKVSELTNDAGYTTNIGTVIQVKIGSTAYNPSSGIISLPDYPTTLPASDVYSWAKAATKPSYNYSEISDTPTIPTKVSQLINDSGYTTNTGTVTQVKIGSTAYNPTSGVISLPDYPTTLPASDVYSWAKAATKPSYNASEVGAATSDHTHTLDLATSTGTSSITLAASSKYKLTAGGSTFIFTTPPNTTYSSKTAASGGTDVSLVTTGEKYTWNSKSDLQIGTTATTAAAGNHTHTASIAADSGTNQLMLTASTKYKLTAGGSTFIFTTPSDTTYSSKTAASGGTELSLVTTGEKYTWNNKSDLKIGTTSTTAAAGNHTHSGYASSSHDHHSTAYSTQALRHLASGTAAATTSNCPSGAWYGYHT